MKKIISVFTFLSFFLVSSTTSLYSQSSNYSELEKRFIKGSLSDKIQCVQNSDGKDVVLIAQKGLDYVIANSAVLGSDRELVALALASILALPNSLDNANISEEDAKEITVKLINIFNWIDSETVKIAALNRLVSYSKKSDTDFVNVINDFLNKSIIENAQPSLLIDNAIISLGSIGNKDSFLIVYSIWNENRWPEYRHDTENTLVRLSEKSFTEVIKIISTQTLAENSKFFQLLSKSHNISNVFKSEIAENILSVVINNAESLHDSLTDYLNLQFSSFKLITENKWAHASNLVVETLRLAKKEYDNGLITEEQFIEVIRNSIKLGAPEVAKVLSDFLADFNGLVEKNNVPSEPVVLSIIQTLGDLGDKTAFDNLLYVTYLNYSSEIKTAAKEALSKLKW